MAPYFSGAIGGPLASLDSRFPDGSEVVTHELVGKGDFSHQLTAVELPLQTSDRIQGVVQRVGIPSRKLSHDGGSVRDQQNPYNLQLAGNV